MGDSSQGRDHLNRALELYNAADHRVLAPRFGQDPRVAAVSYRSLAHWVLGYTDAAVTDAERALKDAREINQAAELMHALFFKGFNSILCGNYAAADAEGKELASLADEKDSAFFRISGMCLEGLVMANTGKTESGIQIIETVITAYRSIGSTAFFPVYSSYLAWCLAERDRFKEAWDCVGKALMSTEVTKEGWWQAELYRVAGEITLMSKESDPAKVEAYFQRALAVAREQQAKSWELRAATSMARIWRDQGKRDKARDLLASVYGWFTEGFDTLDLKEAKALADELCDNRQQLSF
jgi:predicted ATPase